MQEIRNASEPVSVVWTGLNAVAETTQLFNSSPNSRAAHSKAFLAWGVYARIAAKRRGDLGPQTAPTGWGNDAIVIVVGLIIYLALGYAFHPIVIGVPVFGA